MSQAAMEEETRQRLVAVQGRIAAACFDVFAIEPPEDAMLHPSQISQRLFPGGKR